MRVLVDLRPVHAGLTGIGRYAANLYLSLTQVMGSLAVEAISSRSGVEYLGPLASTPIRVIPDGNTEWGQLVLPDLIRELKAEIYHSPLFVLPSVRVCPYLCTIHDVTPLVRPDLTPPTFMQFFERHIAHAVRVADHIVTVSESSRRDILRHLGVAPERVTAIHEPVSPLFTPKTPESSRGVLDNLGLKPGFILSVGAVDRRKNLDGLLQAYSLLRGGSRIVPPLVIAGAPSGDGFDLESEIRKRNLSGNVRVLGRVSDHVLVHLYSSAAVFAFPSRHEGFGLPVLEAMASGTPVVTSSAASLPEVAGDAALIVDPEDPRALKEAIDLILSDPARAGELRKRGLARAQEFTLNRQGERLRDLYDRVLKEVA
jgi:alpha-1,3-rhamnosyl/mannosyltransferase